jgi:hypothetical protein
MAYAPINSSELPKSFVESFFGQQADRQNTQKSQRRKDIAHNRNAGNRRLDIE